MSRVPSAEHRVYQAEAVKIGCLVRRERAMYMQWLRLIICSSVVATLLAGCGMAPTSDYAEDDSEPTVDSSGAGSDKITLNTGNPAVKDLWAQAEQARKAGDYDN